MRSGSPMQWFGLALAALLGGGCVADDPISGRPTRSWPSIASTEPMRRRTFSSRLQRRTLEEVTTFPRLESPAFRVRQGGTFTVTGTRRRP